MYTSCLRMQIVTRLLLLFLGLSHQLPAQSLLRGRVLDQTTQEALVGVTIQNAQTSTGTFTDERGYFEIAWASELLISHIGYQALRYPPSQEAQDLIIYLKPQAESLSEIIVQAASSPRFYRHTAGSVALVDSLALVRDAEINIQDALNRIPGIYFHNGALNTNRLTVRGIGSRSLFSTRNIRAYLDEIPLSTGENETTLEDLDLDILDRVEILKGPGPSAYGAGLGGTLLLRSRAQKTEGTFARHQSQFGSYGLRKTKQSFGIQHRKLQWNATYTNLHSEGYRDNNQYDRHSVYLLGQVRPNPYQKLSFLGIYQSLVAFIPSSLNADDFRENPRQAAFTWGASQGNEDAERGTFGLSFQNQGPDAWDWSGSIFMNFRQAREIRPFNLLNEQSQNAGLRFQVGYNFKILGFPASVRLGGEYFRELYEAETFENEDRTYGAQLSNQEQVRQYGNAFLMLSQQVTSKLFLETSLHSNKTLYEVRDFIDPDNEGNYTFETIWSPRLGLRYQVNDLWNLQFTLSHGFSQPAVDETLTPEGQFNPDIQPETGWNYELSSRGSLLKGRFWYSLSVYTMRIKNLLVARRTASDAFVGVNAGSTRHNGIELEANALLWQNMSNQGRFFVNYTLADYTFKDFVDLEDDFSGNDLTGTPRNTLNAGLDVNLPWGFFTHLNIQWIDRIPINDANTVYSDSYFLTHVKLGHRLQWKGGWTLETQVGIRNLFDERYASMLQINALAFGNALPRYFYPGLPRNYFGGIKLSWQLSK